MLVSCIKNIEKKTECGYAFALIASYIVKNVTKTRVPQTKPVIILLLC